jgi:hypothetical protein
VQGLAEITSDPDAFERFYRQHVEAVQRYFFDQLSKDEIETMAAVFDRVLDNLRRKKA